MSAAAANTVLMAGSLHFPAVTRIAISLLALAVSACHPVRVPTPGASTGAARPSIDRVTIGLQRDIDAILSAPELARGYWGVVIKSVKTDQTLYAVNGGKLMMPASTMKIVTLAAAAEKLGWNYTYETILRAVGTIDNGVLNGDVVVVGSGDPSLMAGEGADRLFASWATRLKDAGIRAVTGRVIGDATAFGGEALGFGWSWDDLPDGFAAGIGALQLNEDAVRVTVSSGPAVGDSAAVSTAPAAGALAIDNGVITSAAADGQPAIRLRRLPGSSRLVLRGSIPIGHAPVVFAASVDQPTRFFVGAVRAALIASGIDVRGSAVDVTDLADAPSRTAGRLIASYQSPPLATLALRLMKASQNQYAETLLKTIGSVQPTLEAWGVAPGDLIQRDGSGLSRYDYVTPAALVTILAHVDRDARLKEPFEASLPIAGRDGSLANRMKGTAAEDNARAKTGSMSNVRALSGYVTTRDGDPLVFSIIANNFEIDPETVNRAADAIVVRLAELAR